MPSDVISALLLPHSFCSAIVILGASYKLGDSYFAAAEWSSFVGQEVVIEYQASGSGESSELNALLTCVADTGPRRQKI